MLYKAPRGTADILPDQQPYWHRVVETAERLCRLYGYRRIDTPTFEDARLFERSVGEETDIVAKETYTFKDRGGDLLTLRPEGTAPVCRAYLEHGMQNLPQPVKLYYVIPNFRYERPQAGRYRQFYQFGCEALGEQDPALDTELISLAWKLYTDLGLKDLTVLLNSIGDQVCRPNHLAALVAYYQERRDGLCRDCQVRLEKNPLRLLDCKQPQDQEAIAGAPKTIDYLCDDCRTHFDALRGYLDALEIPYQLEHKLVRGFDYYTKTVFEIMPAGGGSQSAVGGGGRYDGLIEQLGGKPTPGIGFGAGIERIVLNLQRQEITVPDGAAPSVYVAPVGQAARDSAVRLVQQLRDAGVSATMGLGDRSLRAQLRHANTLGARYAAIIGDDELAKGAVTLRRMEDGEQEEVGLAGLVGRMSAN
jgi:histidyl-tRNA synthetase